MKHRPKSSRQRCNDPPAGGKSQSESQVPGQGARLKFCPLPGRLPQAVKTKLARGRGGHVKSTLDRSSQQMNYTH